MDIGLFEFKIKKILKEVKNFLLLVISLLFATGVIYLIYYSIIQSDESVLSYSENIFAPLADTLNSSCFNCSKTDIYRNTGLKLILIDVFIFMLFRFVVFLENAISSISTYQKEQKEKNILKKEEENYQKQFDLIEEFSICISLEILDKKDEENIEINKIFIEKFEKFFREVRKLKKVAKSPDKKTILTVCEFETTNFDNLLDETLVFLSLLKRSLEKQFKKELIFTITINAYDENLSSKEIIQQHAKINAMEQFKNRILSQDIFDLKYKHLHHKKYAGIPLGYYVFLDNDDVVSLNIISKNLNADLNEILKR